METSQSETPELRIAQSTLQRVAAIGVSPLDGEFSIRRELREDGSLAVSVGLGTDSRSFVEPSLVITAWDTKSFSQSGTELPNRPAFCFDDHGIVPDRVQLAASRQIGRDLAAKCVDGFVFTPNHRPGDRIVGRARYGGELGQFGVELGDYRPRAFQVQKRR
jgi:hypothetical protein